jgi:hypothetical protein
MAHDEIFAEPKALPTDFQFDHKTAAVFDDMVSRVRHVEQPRS